MDDDARKRNGPGGRAEQDGDPIATLLRSAGPRPGVSEARSERVKAAVRARWRSKVRSRARRRIYVWSGGALAAAALVVASIVFGLWQRSETLPPPTGPVATVEAVKGSVAVTRPGIGSKRELAVDDVIDATSELETGAGRAAIRLAGGASVRLNRGTRLRLLSDDVMILDRGIVYVDSGFAGDGTWASLEVRTPVGVVRDIGTQFEVHARRGALRVRVREGRVVLDRDGRTHEAESGSELSLDASGAVRRRSVSLHGSEWSWVQEIAPPFVLEGRPLEAFLEWVSRESGWTFDYADDDVEAAAFTTILHGSIEGLTPDEALTAVLPACGLGHRLENGRLIVEPLGGTTDSH